MNNQASVYLLATQLLGHVQLLMSTSLAFDRQSRKTRSCTAQNFVQMSEHNAKLDGLSGLVARSSLAS